MGSHRRLPFAFVLPVLPVLLLVGGASALAQGPTFGIGRTPSPEEIKALDISIGPNGEELPPGQGNAKEGAQLYRTKGCAACHGAQGIGGSAPVLKSKDPKNPDLWARGRILPLRSPFATTVWDYINRGMPLNREGTLTPDEVYSLTAYLLFINDVIPEDQALDRQSLPTVKMPIGNNYAALPDWKPRTKRLPGYPY
jgi:cytochrome c